MTPDYVYKYCDTRGTDILLKLRLKITPPNRFNDPFELAPRMKASVARREALKLIKNKQSQRAIFEKMTANGQFTGNFKEFRKVTRSHREKMVQAVQARYPDVAADLRRDFIDPVSSEYGLLCLSAVSDNILMWSHYSRSHTGIVVGLDGRHALLSSNEPELVPVEYREERVKMGYHAARRSRELQEQINSLIRRKSPQWSYEREWRQLRFLRQCKKEEDASSLGRVNYFFLIEPQLIRQVIIGCRAPKTLIREITKIKTLSHFAHVQFLHACMHKTDFALEFELFSASS
jgi:hypothetical protein